MPAPPESRGDMPVIPGYEILGEIGRGGMGVVYLAMQSSLKRLVALKMILVGADATMRIRFRTEAEAVARLRHANIVQIHEVGEHDGRPYLCLEYADGGSLQEGGRQRGPAGAARPLDWSRDASARAMHYTHQNGILAPRSQSPQQHLAHRGRHAEDHRFRTCQAPRPGRRPSTRAEAVLIGTPNYMPPEQAAGDINEDRRAGRCLFPRRHPVRLADRPRSCSGARRSFNTLEQVRTQEPRAPRRLRGRIGRDLETICLKCLEKEPEHRYASAAALAADLERFLEGQTIRARPLPRWQQLWRYGRRAPASR